MHSCRRAIMLVLTICLWLGSGSQAIAWGRGHRLIRLWAVAHLPQWQRDLIGQQALGRLCKEYTSLQDKHAGGRAPELDRYCIVPGVRLSLHDVNPAEPSARATRWYLDQIAAHLAAEETDEAMKFLGVLCHWNEDPGCPSAHSSPVSEVELKLLLPPPANKERFNYLYGAGGIMDTGDYEIEDVPYEPVLLGRTLDEAVLRICQRQRLLQRQAAMHIVPIIQDMMHGDGRKADTHRAAAALINARHTADVIYTVLCLSTGRFGVATGTDSQLLTEWLPEFKGGMIPHPYYVTPFLIDQAMDARRQLHPLKFFDTEPQPRQGYGMGTPFSLDFILAPGNVFAEFEATVGLHSRAGPDGAVRFAVVANGEELARTDVVKSGDQPVRLRVRLPQVDVLRLSLRTVAADGSTPGHNLTVWSKPVLLRQTPKPRD